MRPRPSRSSGCVSGERSAPVRRAPCQRVVVDESEDVDAVLGVLGELAVDELADPAGADDHRVLDVRQPAPGERSCGHPAK